MNLMKWNDPDAHFSGPLLALDTSTAAMSLALLDKGRLLQEAHIHADRTHSLHLIPMLQELIQSAGMKPADLSGIAVGVGPGSYTGVRIGVTAAKTLAWTLKLPVIGVSSLEAMALGAAKSQEDPAGRPHWFVPLMDARRAQAYTALYSAHGDNWQCLAADGIRLMERWLGQLTQCSEPVQPAISFVGESAAFLEPYKSAALLNAPLTRIREVEISAQYVGLLGSLRLASGERANVHQLIPNYTQLTEAEANLLVKPH